MGSDIISDCDLKMSNPIDDKHIEDSEKFVEASGSIWEKYQEWQKELATESVFDNKTRELLMLAVSAGAQCPYCVHTHGQKAAKHGASKEEIAHTVHLASEVKAGASMAYGLEALEHVD